MRKLNKGLLGAALVLGAYIAMPGAHQALAQRHEAAALGIDQRVAVPGACQSISEFFGICQHRSMQFGISAGQKDRVGALVRRLIGERGEEADFRPIGAPVIQPVMVNEREAGVAGDCHVLTERRHRQSGGGW